MSENRNAQYRYQVLDRCFSDWKKKYTIEDLLDIVNKHLYELEGPDSIIQLRQLRGDLNAIRKMLPDNVYLDAKPFDGKKCYYRYTLPDFSIYQNGLTVEEVNSLRSTIEMLGKYRGVAENAWLEDVISNLELRFGVKSNGENLISFQQNSGLKGLEFLATLIDATINHQALKVSYTTHAGKKSTNVLHPYFMKQYNNRWFVFGRIDGKDYIVNRALDRIEEVSKCDVPFCKNDLVDFNSYFDDIVGVSVPYKKEELRTITLRFTPGRFKYAVSKPIHSSQTVVDDNECVIAVKVIPTRELDQAILAFGPDVEVLSPKDYRAKIESQIEECLKKYRPVH